MAWQDANRARSNAVANQVPAERTLDEAFWERFGAGPNPSMREKIVLVTIDDVGRVGAATFNVKLVCQELEVSQSLINHHFGSRDELIAEAAIRWYELYVEALWSAALDAKQTPEARLRAWLNENVEWSRKFNGMSALLDYPTASSDVTEMINRNHRGVLTEIAELNLARLVSLVVDMRAGEVGLYALQRGAVDRSMLMRDEHTTKVAGSIAWAILGMSVWTAGVHLPTTHVEGVEDQVAGLREFYLDHLIAFAKNG